jgi:hypothetical protein
VKTWEKTRLSYLVRHKRTGGYYARAYAKGKEVWRSLKTKHFSVAESGLAKFLKTHRERRKAQAQASSAKLTFGAAAEIYRRRLADNPKVKREHASITVRILASLKGVGRVSAKRKCAGSRPRNVAIWLIVLREEAVQLGLTTAWQSCDTCSTR